MFRIKLITKLIHINENIFFYPKLKKIYQKIISTESPVILDVGSNKGQSIDFFLNIYPDSIIYGFEPNERLARDLAIKYKKNVNIKIFNCGISDKKGKLILSETITSETSTFEELNYDSDYLKLKAKILGVSPKNIISNKYEVDVVTLSEFISQNKIKKIDILKIDTEGHEYKCLLGLFGNGEHCNIKYMQIEQHYDDMYSNIATFGAINELLAKNDFTILEKIKHGFGDFEEIVFAYNK